MVLPSSVLLSGAVLFARVGGAFLIPHTTPIIASTGLTPEPTTPPSPLELRLRQNEEDRAIWAAEGDTNIGGYTSGHPGSAWACASKNTNVFLFLASQTDGHVFCIQPGHSAFQAITTTCLDRGVSCDATCQRDTQRVRQCTDAALPYCETGIIFASRPVTKWACRSVKVSTPVTILTTQNGGTSRTFQDFTRFAFVAPTTPVETSTTPSTTAAEGDTTPRTTARTADDQTTETSGPTSAVPAAEEQAQPVPVGAIAGGAVGGAAVLALGILGAALLVRRPRRAEGGGGSPEGPPAYVDERTKLEMAASQGLNSPMDHTGDWVAHTSSPTMRSEVPGSVPTPTVSEAPGSNGRYLHEMAS